MANLAVDLVTFAEAQPYVGAPAGDQAYVEQIITSASEWINGYVGYVLVGTDYDGTDDDSLYDGDGSNSLWTKQFPLNTITTIHQDADRTFGSDTLIAASDYVFYSTGKILLPNDRWYVGAKTIKVVYNAGYATIPDDLKQACIAIVDYYYKAFRDHRFGDGGETTVDYTISYIHGIPTEAKKLCDKYKRLSFG